MDHKNLLQTWDQHQRIIIPPLRQNQRPVLLIGKSNQLCSWPLSLIQGLPKYLLNKLVYPPEVPNHHQRDQYHVLIGNLLCPVWKLHIYHRWKETNQPSLLLPALSFLWCPSPDEQSKSLQDLHHHHHHLGGKSICLVFFFYQTRNKNRNICIKGLHLYNVFDLSHPSY